MSKSPALSTLCSTSLFILLLAKKLDGVTGPIVVECVRFKGVSQKTCSEKPSLLASKG
ncbi:hypothetical protein Bpfe_004317 [Biomphalaria pfeifferi]|uniref:Uncharacterized protein n=1 Tax=Biomphalaria pfeifferi TaxID=112525 RepID=A0AAD8C4A8_BIOPF|nr:hypothetical protein Bpfe_004317 [Biomphalaria pfeifferi]